MHPGVVEKSSNVQKAHGGEVGSAGKLLENAMFPNLNCIASQ